MMRHLFRNALIALAAGGIMLSSVAATPVHANAHLAGGDFFQAFNNTTQEGTWRDPVSAAPGNVIEYRVMIKNDGDQVAHGVQVWGSVTGQVPQDPAMTQVITARITDQEFNGEDLTDTATVNLTGNTPAGMRYYPGHARLNGTTNLFNCPNTCDIGDNVLGGIEVGDIQPGDFVEVSFKVAIVNVPTPTPSSTPTSTPTATPTSVPTATPTATPVTPGSNNNSNTNCTSNSCTGTGGSATNTNNITVTTAAPAQPQVVTVAGSSNVKKLPETGLPLAGLALGGLLPAGLKARKFGKSSEDVSANTLWEEKQFKS